jgi:hypothetical protein
MVEVEVPSDTSSGVIFGDSGGVVVLERIERLSRAMGNKQVRLQLQACLP